MSSVGAVSLDVVQKYIENQKKSFNCKREEKKKFLKKIFSSRKILHIIIKQKNPKEEQYLLHGKQAEAL